MNRRKFLTTSASAGAAGLIATRPAHARPSDSIDRAVRHATDRGSVLPAAKFRLSVTRWPFHQFTLEQLSQMARELGIDSVELLEPDEWAVPLRY